MRVNKKLNDQIKVSRLRKQIRDDYREYQDEGGTMGFYPWLRNHVMNQELIDWYFNGGHDHYMETLESEYQEENHPVNPREEDLQMDSVRRSREIEHIVRENLTDKQIGLLRQQSIFTKLGGNIKVFETKGKMQKLKPGYAFCILPKMEDVWSSHWYQIVSIDSKEKSLVLRSLQHNKEYNWRYKGGNHLVIPAFI